MNFKLDAMIVERLNRYSQESMIPKTRIVEKALEDFLNKVEYKNSQ